MFDFIEKIFATAWDLSAVCYRWWASWIDKPWLLVVIGAVLVIAAFVVAHMDLTNDGDAAISIYFPDEGWSLFAVSFMFIVEYFNDFATWQEIDGFAGLFAWVSTFFFVFSVGALIISLLQSLWSILDALFDGFSDWAKKYFIKIVLLLICWGMLLLGLLLMTALTGPIAVIVFFIGVLLTPTSKKIGTFEDRDGNRWDVWRN